MAKKLKITWVRSAIRREDSQKVTIEHLGLHKLHDSVIQPNNAQIRGMVRKVVHLVKTEEVEA